MCLHEHQHHVLHWLSVLEKRRESVIKLGLQRVYAVAEKLQLLHWQCPLILVGGTNGKGSTVRAIEILYHAAGYRVASYTSPHLYRFHERISYQLLPIDDASLIQAFSVISDQETEPLTYFEFATLSALWFFKQKNPDLLILEVGLGGRLDATNIINADLAILTTIDFDHEAYLGHTLEAIAFEKAGIFRAGQTAILATPMMPKCIKRMAAKRGTSLICYGQDYYHILQAQYQWLSSTFTWQDHMPKLNPFAVSTAIMISRLWYDKKPVALEAYQVLMQATLKGRLQVFQGAIEIVCDVAHNCQAVSYLFDFLKRYPAATTIRAVFSAFKDKAIQAMLGVMATRIHTWFVAPLEGERAADLSLLRMVFEHYDVSWYNDLISAFYAAREHSKTGDVIVVFGSFKVVSAILPYLEI